MTLALQRAECMKRALTRRIVMGLRDPRDQTYTKGKLSVWMMTCLSRKESDQVKKATTNASSSQKLMSSTSSGLGNQEMLSKADSGRANQWVPKTPPTPRADASVNR